MIYLSPDYTAKYSDVLSEILALAKIDEYSNDYIETTIANSKPFKELEYSDVTEIAFKSTMSLYRALFPSGKAIDKDIKLFSPYYWIGEMYIHIFIKYKITFEAIFSYIPIGKMEELFATYHEMDINQFDKYVEKVLEEKPLSIWMRKRKITCIELSKKTQIPLTTIRSLKNGQRDINKLQACYLEKISSVLLINPRSLLECITLNFCVPNY